MAEWKQSNKLPIHNNLIGIISELKNVVELELSKTEKKLENLKRIYEMKDQKNGKMGIKK